MDFRVRHLKQNKQSSNSTIEFPRNLDFLSPKSLDYQCKDTLAHLEARLKGLAEAQRTDHALCMGLISKLQASVYSLECRIGQSGKNIPLLRHLQLSANDAIDPSSAEDLLLLHNPSILGHNQPHWQRHPPSNQHSPTINEPAGKEGVCQSSVAKAIDGVRTQFEGKLKALADRLQLNFNIKSQFDAKIKEEERKARLAQEQKRATEAQNKLKAQIQQEILIKLSRRVKQETQDISNKAQSSITSLKKRLIEDLEKDRMNCLQQISKAKLELQGRVKARDERIDYNPKRELQAKKKDEQFNLKLQGLTSKISEIAQRIKKDIMLEVKEKIDPIVRGFATIKGQLDQAKLQFHDRSRKIQELVQQISIREAEATKEGQRSLREQLMAVVRTVKEQSVINSENIKSFRESLREKIATNTIMLENKLSVVASEGKSVLSALSKMQASIFAQRQTNKAFSQKISNDILDIADSLAAVVQDMKPYRQ